ncbi:unnamed protein product [Nezara viridula]|uniref:Thioredoxin domain-containing protein n=1 Tax=Nezara viridula TaxID=85310 RepID=A0A9P0E611_NEZVI|nr:unnamed protein product [Nezara viridula]
MKETHTLTVTEMEELEEILDNAGPKLVVIDFTAPWCGPCKLTGGTMEELAGVYPDVVFIRVDVSELEEAGSMFQISVLPTFSFVRNKEKIEDFIGGKMENFKMTIERLRGAMHANK